MEDCAQEIGNGERGVSMRILILFGLSCALAHSQALPEAPQPYFHNALNRALAASEASTRLLDFISTYQFEHDPCGCIFERGHFYGTFSLATVSKSTPLSFTYQAGMAGVVILASRGLWKASQKHHSRLLRMASRGVLLYDLRYQVEEPVNNWREIATNGKRGF